MRSFGILESIATSSVQAAAEGAGRWAMSMCVRGTPLLDRETYSTPIAQTDCSRERSPAHRLTPPHPPRHRLRILPQSAPRRLRCLFFVAIDEPLLRSFLVRVLY